MITPPALFALQAPANEAVAKAQTPLLAAAEHGMAYVATRLIDKCPKEQRAGFLEKEGSPGGATESQPHGSAQQPLARQCLSVGRASVANRGRTVDLTTKCFPWLR